MIVEVKKVLRATTEVSSHLCHEFCECSRNNRQSSQFFASRADDYWCTMHALHANQVMESHQMMHLSRASFDAVKRFARRLWEIPPGIVQSANSRLDEQLCLHPPSPCHKPCWLDTSHVLPKLIMTTAVMCSRGGSCPLQQTQENLPPICCDHTKTEGSSQLAAKGRQAQMLYSQWPQEGSPALVMELS